MSWRAENWSVAILAALLGVGLVVSIATFSQSSSNGSSLEGVHTRLEALEAQRSPATAKRWTSDDEMELIACLEHKNGTPARRACINRITARIKR